MTVTSSRFEKEPAIWEVWSALSEFEGVRLGSPCISGSAVLCSSQSHFYKFRGLTPAAISDHTFASSQLLTLREFNRLQDLSSICVDADMLQVEARQGQLAVLRTVRAVPIELDGAAGRNVPMIADWLAQRIGHKSSGPRATTEHWISFMLPFLETMPEMVAALSGRLDAISSTLENFSYIAFPTHGDTRISNIGTVDGAFKMFDPAIMPRLYESCRDIELLKFFASVISEVGQPLRANQLSEYVNFSPKAISAIVSYFVIHRILYVTSLAKRGLLSDSFKCHVELPHALELLDECLRDG